MKSRRFCEAQTLLEPPCVDRRNDWIVNLLKYFRNCEQLLVHHWFALFIYFFASQQPLDIMSVTTVKIIFSATKMDQDVNKNSCSTALSFFEAVAQHSRTVKL